MGQKCFEKSKQIQIYWMYKTTNIIILMNLI